MSQNHGHGHSGHGHSVAAWVAVSIIFAGFVLGGLALVLSAWWLFWTSGAVVVVGAIVGKVLSMMGMGTEPARRHHPSELGQPASRQQEGTS